MDAKDCPAILLSTNTLKVLSFLSENTGSDFTVGELLEQVNVSKSGAYLALDELLRLGIISKYQRGKFLLYSANYEDPFIRQLKVLISVSMLKPLLSRLQPLALSIRLFGSVGRGEDRPDSDIDLFILTANPEPVKTIISSQKLGRKIQAIIKTPSEWAGLKGSDPVFHHEIDNGITLWESKS